MNENEFVAQEFINEFGQTISPGDRVMYTGTAWKNTVNSLGTFSGVYINEKNEVVACKIINIPCKKFVWDDYHARIWHYLETFRSAVLPLKRVYKIDFKKENPYV